jgi:uncharacterized protein YodC (DUF2158 family)
MPDSTPERLKPGDLVYLRSGSPAMTVVGEVDNPGGPLLECMWISSAGPMTIKVPARALDPAPPSVADRADGLPALER